MKVTILAAGVMLAAMSVSARAEGNPYRKISNGVGNCVFSKAGALEFEQESSYQVTAEFQEGDAVHMRCYYDKLGNFTKEGKLQNSLRHAFGKGMIGEEPYTRVTLYWKDDTEWWFARRAIYVAAEDESRTTSRYDLIPGGKPPDDCDWNMGKFEHPEQCVDLATETKNLRKFKSKTGKFTATICVKITYEKVDKTRLVDLTDVDIIEEPVISEGCFKYTVK